ncbi:class I SAM-dependent methyltransferase [Nonomuraea africana]|uniref:SAM-dependent methyltransferase n=1 Tax=Nonomuraea africana TaxID=46171 RepID=A0ABR9KDB6_9ACTN|nr:class I SAM-dependent methyltransferase [Nonomuraea africana]MBE1560013.1 SAM-dependent methyltransferase [Nonomuraea africana]
MAESFGSDVDRYDRSRPRYPDALVERIVAGSPGPDVVAVGCGTGIEARQFQTAGCRVLGVEPDARMADFARRSGVAVEVATFEAWDPDGRTFDAVVAGQAWHWVDPVAGAAKAAQVLRPGGRLAVFWNAFQTPPDVGEAFAAVYRRVMPDSPIHQRAMPGPDGYAVLCATAADGVRQAGAFGAPEQWRFDWEQPYTRDEWLDQLPTFGLHTRLPPDRLQEVLAGIGAAIDAVGGGFTMRYTTLAVTAARTATPDPAPRTATADIDEARRRCSARGMESPDVSAPWCSPSPDGAIGVVHRQSALSAAARRDPRRRGLHDAGGHVEHVAGDPHAGHAGEAARVRAS